MLPMQTTVSTLCQLRNFVCFFVICWNYQSKSTILKTSFRNSIRVSETAWIQIRPDIVLGLIWVQTVWKGYQQTTLEGKELNWIPSRAWSSWDRLLGPRVGSQNVRSRTSHYRRTRDGGTSQRRGSWRNVRYCKFRIFCKNFIFAKIHICNLTLKAPRKKFIWKCHLLQIIA